MRSSSGRFLVVGAVLPAAVGLLLVSVSLSGRSVPPLLAGLVLLATAAAVVLFTRAGGGSSVTVREADNPAVRVALRPHLPVATLLVLGSLSALVLYGILAFGLDEGGALLLPVLLLVAAPLPDTVRALLRRPGVTLTAEAVALRGWGADARLSWDDVTGAALVVPHPRRPAVRFSGRPGAASWRFTPRRLVVPLDRRPDGPHIDVPLQGLGEPDAFLAAGERLVGLDPTARAGLLRDEVPRLLAGESPSREIR